MRPAVVVVAHPDAMVSEGLAAGLAQRPGIVPLASVTTADQAERLGERADAVALDARLPGAAEAASHLRANGVRVVMITDLEGDGAREDVYVRRGAPISVLADALVPGYVARPEPSSILTRRERQILSLVANGLAAKQVARHLGISAKTVEQHKMHIYSKLGVSNQTAAVSLVFARGGGEAILWTQSSM